MKYKNRFKKFGGGYILDIVEYLTEYIKTDPFITISVGVDSIQSRKRTIFACTVMLYNQDIKNGAHVIFFRESCDKVRDNFERLSREAMLAYEVAEYLNENLSGFFTRKDLEDYDRKKYKFHIAKCNNEYTNVPHYNEDSVTRQISLSPYEKNIQYNLVDIHLDFNPFSGRINEKGHHKNKSYDAYRAFVPWLRGMNYRVWAKPASFAASSAADLLLQD